MNGKRRKVGNTGKAKTGFFFKFIQHNLILLNAINPIGQFLKKPSSLRLSLTLMFVDSIDIDNEISSTGIPPKLKSSAFHQKLCNYIISTFFFYRYTDNKLIKKHWSL